MTIRIRRAAPVALAILAALAAGCAARASGGSVSSASSTSAAPPKDAMAPGPDFNPSDPSVLEREIRRVMSSTLPSAEAWDDRLAAVLGEMTVSPTPRQHLEAAAEYRRLGIFDDALKYLTKALAFPETRPAAYEALARLWRDAGHLSVAIGHAHRAVAHAPTASSYNTLGTILTALGWLEDGRDAFSRAASLEPSAAYARSNLCYSFYLSREFDRAIDACRAAIAVDADSAAARNNLALAFAAAGRLEQASDAFDRAGDPADGKYNMGLVYLALGQFERAADEFETAHRLRPSFELADIRARQARALAGARR